MNQIFTLPPGSGLSSLVANYDVVLCDVWGVLHNGVAAWPSASEALVKFRGMGGTVVLVSNAPRPVRDVEAMLDQLGVPRGAYDAIITSGAVTRTEIDRRGIKFIHPIGPQRDNGLFDGLELVPVEEAQLAVVTGLEDDTRETPEDYRTRLTDMHAHGLDLICANPDRVVERGDQLVWCAGAVAELYEQVGGEVLYIGKPFPGIYERALEIASTLRGSPVPKARALAIGDSMITDVAGANAFGVDCLFVTGGIHGADIGHPPVTEAYNHILRTAKPMPVGWTHRLSWD
ncbi:TIGR01459 family HAD-type hydrolase [Terrihabitans rhizophilus]|uniref:TIGR01459 family HAD-type hydrolase n=1 Tax=Terrihabitans rhizophilus TaxID=3092662 RepID=A0ABU4RPY4_9HYPH|nr:TIGR01459 family HAD-type hydrolase [Terrihabitans sp. PJ23]MDX6806882.1 TIGR01459 family HAD-type hydrolase [Terrihabitans sp. PJ23]